MNEVRPADARRVGRAVTWVSLGVLVWALVSQTMCTSHFERQMAEGHRAMHRGDFAVACRHYKEAASTRLLDEESVYALSVCERLREGGPKGDFERAILDGDWEGARSAVSAQDEVLGRRQAAFVEAVEKAL